MNLDISWLLTLWFGFEILVRVAAFFIVPRGRKPSSATGWLLLIMIFPTIGLIAFLLIGSPKLSRRRREAQQLIDQVISAAVDEALATPKIRKFVRFDLPERYQPMAALNTSLTQLPVFSGNKINLIPEYEDTFTSMVRDIKQAQKFVHIEFFIIVLDETTEELFAALESAVNRGVKVRVLFDAIGSRNYPRFKEMKARLSAGGIEWYPMLPLRLPGKRYTRPDLRNHRKIAVIDAEIGYTGSLNLVRRNYHRKDDLYYEELMARIEGPVVVQLYAIFLSDWYAESGELLTREATPEARFTLKQAGEVLAQALPSGPGYEYENNLKLFTSLIYAAKKRVVITNPYFVPDESLMAAIVTAAQRGVEVVMINSDIMDKKTVGHAQRSYYEELLQASVKIYWYPWPVLLHSKHITIDDDICVIGSSNFDIRSFELDLEISIIVYDKQVTQRLQKIEASYLAKSRPVLLSDWQKRSLLTRLLDNLARLTSALQ